MNRPIGISVPHRRVDDDDDIQEYKRPWVGLTDEERKETLQSVNTGFVVDADVVAHAIEAKLKEKNSG